MDSKVLQKRIAHVEKEIQAIETFFYGGDEKDLENRYFLLKLKRDQVIRGIVLELHLSIDSIIDSLITCYLLRNNPKSSGIYDRSRSDLRNSIEDLVSGDHSVNFKNKIVLLRSAGIIRKSQFDDLATLNKIRNKCAHNWMINSLIRRRVKRTKQKKHLLEYNGKNLYKLDIFKDFIGEYGHLYVQLWLKEMEYQEQSRARMRSRVE